MRSVEVENFSFQMFNNKTKLVQKPSHYIVATKEMRVRTDKRFVLRNEKSIIHKQNNRNWNVKNF